MKKVISIMVIILLVALVAIYFSINSLAKSAIHTFGPKFLNVPVLVESVNISPFSGKGTIKGLVVGSPEGFDAEYTFALESISIDMDVTTLLSHEVIINQILIEQPHIIYMKKLGGSNIETLMSHLQQEEQTESSSSDAEPTRVIINDLYINDGKVSGAIGFAGATLPIPDLHLTDLGKDKDASPLDVLMTVFKKLFDVLGALDLSNLSDIAVGAVDKVGGAVGSLGDGLSGLFGGNKDKQEVTE